jgi:hypothetical protein
MGFNRNITSASYQSFKKSKNITSQSSFDEIYTSKDIKDKYVPNGVTRESRDSAEHPNSTAIIFGIDSTGSMSSIYEKVAKRFETAVVEIFNRLPVSDPQVMFAAIDDVEAMSRIKPLQVTQFEVDTKIAEQLFDLHFTGYGCGNGFESYQLLWYFAAKHTSIDCYEKRHKKGVLLTVGDDGPQMVLSKMDIKTVFGDTDLEKDYTAEELLELVNKKYEVYHICLEQGGSYRDRDYQKWKDLLGSHALKLSDYDKLPELMVSILEVYGGKDVDTVAKTWDGSTGLIIKDALGGLAVQNHKSGDIIKF